MMDLRLIARIPPVVVFSLVSTLLLGACVAPPKNSQRNKSNSVATTKTAPLIQPLRFGDGFVPLNFASRKFGTNTCTTTLRSIGVRGNEVRLSVARPEACGFEKLDLIVGVNRYPLQALDSGFIAKGRNYVWDKNVNSADLLFTLNEPLTERATLGTFGIVEPNCGGEACLTDIKSGKGELCSGAVIPNPYPIDNESTEYYGTCNAGNRAHNGIVIWKYNGTAYDISCLKDGSFPQVVGEFDSCAKYWQYVPNYCKIDTYDGQCVNGVPDGVGYRHTVEYTRMEVENGGLFGAIGSAFAAALSRPSAHKTFKGMFKNGKLDGYGEYFAISGCGPAGCSGNRIKEKGWFDGDTLKITCNSLPDCTKKVSGQAFTFRLKNNNAQQTSASKNDGSFESYIQSFDQSGNPEDLRKAKSLAITNTQLAALEFSLLRTAGYDKALTLTAKVTDGKTSINVADAQRWHGFFRTVNGSVPTRIIWNIAPSFSGVKLKHGSYSAKITVGIKVKTSKQICLGSICNRHEDTDNYSKDFLVTLNDKNGYKAQGIYDLSVDGTATSVLFGTQSKKDIISVEPIINVDSVEPAK